MRENNAVKDNSLLKGEYTREEPRERKPIERERVANTKSPAFLTEWIVLLKRNGERESGAPETVETKRATGERAPAVKINRERAQKLLGKLQFYYFVMLSKLLYNFSAFYVWLHPSICVLKLEQNCWAYF